MDQKPTLRIVQRRPVVDRCGGGVDVIICNHSRLFACPQSVQSRSNRSPAARVSPSCPKIRSSTWTNVVKGAETDLRILLALLACADPFQTPLCDPTPAEAATKAFQRCRS